ncbi:MAG: DUF1700 domain-containing protein [Clostridiales bacterium]|nr:DUF1700 domain-containing protein [Clostridiales bacterium]MDD7309853.1 DUF1700 domain-containing protein [Eubacteriales bacterium]MDY5347064.1 DUF1700 domain-containing protein [Eubacteriales bacterium]
MTKNAYLSELADRLRQLPQSEIDKSIAYYSEIIDDRMEEGCSEEEAVNGLEAPVTAAERILQDAPLGMLVRERIRPKQAVSGWIIALLVIGFPVWFPLLLAAAGIVFAMYVVVWSLVFAFFASTFAVGTASLAVLITAFVRAGEGAGLIFALLGVGLLGIGCFILMGLATWMAASGVVRLTAALIRSLKMKLIHGGK